MDTYRATNTTNGKFYIGSTNNFENRKREHLRSRENYPFQSALRKNPDAFEWEVWSDDCDDPVLEQALLDMWYGKECCYNLSQFADRGPDRTGQTHSQEARLKMHKTHKERVDKEGDEFRREMSVRGKKAHREKTEKGKSKLGVKNAQRLHQNRDEDGKSLASKKAAESTHSARDEKGRSIQGVKNAERLHSMKNEEGKSIVGVEGAKRLNSEKDENGKSSQSVRNAQKTHSQRWEDPEHPELGKHHFNTLKRLQRERGYPDKKENRRKVG